MIRKAFLLSLALIVLPLFALAQGKDSLNVKGQIPALDEKGKWSGTATLRGGYNFRTHTWKDNSSNIPHHEVFTGVKLNHKKKNFSVELNLTAGWEMIARNSRRATWDDFRDTAGRVVIREKLSRMRESKYGFSNIYNWKGNNNITYRAFVNNYLTVRDNYNCIGTGNIFAQDFNILNLSVNQEDSYINKSAAGFSLTRQYGGENSFVYHAEVSHSLERKKSLWDTFSDGPKPIVKEWKLKPSFRVNNANTGLKFNIKEPFGIKRMKVEVGGSFIYNQNKDNYCGESKKNNIWVDSTKLSEDFNYLTLRSIGTLNLDYSIGKFVFSARYNLEGFADRLTDRFAKEKFQFEKKPVLTYFNSVALKLGKHHSFSLTNNYTFRRPTYTQLCWYPREGKYEDQMIMGNPKLKNTTTLNATLSYNFNYNGFYTKADYSHILNEREIEETFSKDTLEDGTVITFFSWINNRHSRIYKTNLKTGYNGKRLTASAEFTYYNYSQRAINKDIKKKDHYWNFSAETGYKFERDWSAVIRYSFRSDRRIAYHYKNSYHNLNLRIDKKYKRHTFSLQANGLLDKMDATMYYSEDEKGIWMEKENKNRRYFLLSYTFSF